MDITYIHSQVGLQKISIPIVKFKGSKPGKTLCLTGGVHGNEVFGMVFLNEFIEYAKLLSLETNLAGEIIVIPVLNTLGARFLERNCGDNALNRSFKLKNQNPELRDLFSKLEKQVFSKVDYLIDFHDSGKQLMLMPHARLDAQNPKAMDLLKAYGSDFAYLRKPKTGMLSDFLNKRYEIPVITVESGGKQVANREHLDTALNGVMQTLRYYKMYPGVCHLKKANVLQARVAVKSRVTGILKFHVALGASIKKGQLLASVINPRTLKQTQFHSIMDGWVLGMLESSMAVKGEKFMHLVGAKPLEESLDFKKEVATNRRFKLVKIKM